MGIDVTQKKISKIKKRQRLIENENDMEGVKDLCLFFCDILNLMEI